MGGILTKECIPFDAGMLAPQYITAIGAMVSPKQLQVAQIPHSYANRFVTHHHYLERPIYIAKNVSYGLIALNLHCVGVAMFGFPVWTTYPGLVPPLLPQQCPELIRLATLGGLPANSTSYFLAKCLKALPQDWKAQTGHKPSLVTSFCDTAFGFDGAIYKATNWEAFATLKGRSTNPGRPHGKWQTNHHEQNPSKILFIYTYRRGEKDNKETVTQIKSGI